MIILNQAFVPYYFNNDKIISISVAHMNKEADVWFYKLCVFCEDQVSIEISLDQNAYDRAWREIRDWDSYRYGRPENDVVRSYGYVGETSSDDSPIYPTMVWPSRQVDEGIPPGPELEIP
jgi:hypothetical protein